jgi:cystathionine beta-lyase/cystathionine gamma-synthase
MQHHERNAMAIATMLAAHPRVRRVYYPGLSIDPGHALAKEQMRGFSGMVSFDHAGSYAEVVAFLQRLKVFSLAESLGGVESLVNHPERMTHASVPEDLRRKLGIGPQLIRLSVGIEAAEDLIDDLEQALS